MRSLLFVAALAAVSLAGCGKKAEESAKPSVVVTEDGYTVRSKDGAATITTGTAAAERKLPSFAPLYPGARAEGSVANLGNDKGGGGTLVYKAAATPGAVVDFYKEKTAAAGFKTEMDSNMGAARMFAAKNEASGEGLQVIASAADGGSSVQVIWATRKK